jgi:hypothetical protein
MPFRGEKSKKLFDQALEGTQRAQNNFWSGIETGICFFLVPFLGGRKCPGF